MNYPCDVIRDLLPLYLDGVCSTESRRAVDAHLTKCPDCRALLADLQETENVAIPASSAGQELKKAASFLGVKKRLLRRQLLFAAAVVTVLLLVIGGTVGLLKRSVQLVEYRDNLSVSLTDGDLVGRLRGSRYDRLRIKAVTLGEGQTCLFFCLWDTRWDDLTTGDDVYSEFTLSYAGKGAEQVAAVYYYTGDYAGLETLDDAGLQEVLAQSVCLWEQNSPADETNR